MAKSVTQLLQVPTCYNLVNCVTGTIDYILNGTFNGVDLSLNIGKVVGKVCIQDSTECVTGCWSIQQSLACDSSVNTYSIYNIYDSCEECQYCGCPEDFTTILDVDGNPVNCQEINTLTPTLNGTLQTVVHGSTDGAYGSLGTTFFANITTSPFPITAFYAGGGPSTVLDGYKDFLGNNISKLTTISALANVWGPSATTRLNTVGVWQALPVCDEWIGFSFCVDIQETKTYCIGIGGDNRVRLRIDGIPVINAEIGTYTYYAWSVFEITLTAGQHVFELEGYNNSVAGVCSGSNPASFGAEIYDSTSAALQAMTTALQVTAVTIFTTLDKIGDQFDIGDTNGYTCPDGYAYSSCDNACVQIVTLPYNNCCYELVSCETGDVEYQFTYDGTTNPGVPTPDDINNRVISQFITDTDTNIGCWSIVKSSTEDCTVRVGVDIAPYTNITSIELKDDCDTCRTHCVVLHDCASIQPDVIITFPDLGLYIGKVIKIILASSNIGWPDGTYCVTLSAGNDCTGAIASDIDLATTLVYDDCATCSPLCYLLTDCLDPENTLTVSGDLAAYIGGVVTIQGCRTICWTVQLADSCVDSVPSPPIIDFFPSIGTGNLCSYTVPEHVTDNLVSVDVTINGVLHNIIYTTIVQLFIDINALGLGIFFATDVLEITVAGTNAYGDICYHYEDPDNDFCVTPVCAQTYTNECTYDSFIPGDQNCTVQITIDGVVYTSPTSNYASLSWIGWLNSLNLGLFGVTLIATGPNTYTLYVFGAHIYSDLTIVLKSGNLILTKICSSVTDTSTACEACLPPVPDPIPFVLHQRKVKPGYNTPGCSPEYTENILCNYSEALYDEMVKTRYGITICCDKDKNLDYWDIKRQLLELKVLYNTTGCQLQFPCYSYDLVNLDPLNDTSFTYIDCVSNTIVVTLTNTQGVLTVCAANLPLGIGGSPQVTKGGLCPNPICP